MKKSISSALLAAGLFFTGYAYAQQKAPANLVQALHHAYPAAKNIHWGKEGAGYEAAFVNSGKQLSVNFDASGKITETETDIKVNELPASVLSAVKQKFGSSVNIKEAAIIKKASGQVLYEAEIKGMDYLYDASGKLIETAKD